MRYVLYHIDIRKWHNEGEIQTKHMILYVSGMLHHLFLREHVEVFNN